MQLTNGLRQQQPTESTCAIEGGGEQPEFHDADDKVVEAFIEAHPEGGTLEEIGAVFGLTRPRIGQILAKALAKCLKAAKARGLEVSDFPSRQTTWDRLESN